MANFNLTDASALFKIKYEKLSENVYNSANVLLGRCKKSYDFVGSDMRIAIPQSFAGGVGSGSLPTASKATYGSAKIEAKKLYARVEVDRETIKAALKDEGSFVRATKEVVKKGVESYMRNMSRILFSDSTGKLGTVYSITVDGQDEITLNVGLYKEADLEEGDLVDIMNGSSSSKRNLSGPLEITSVEVQSDGTCQVVISGSESAGAQVADEIFMQNSKNNDPEGLKGIVKSKASLDSASKTPYGITPTRKWSSVENSASSASISTDLLNKLMLDVEKKCGKAPNLLITSYKQYEKILNLLEDNKRYEVKTRAGLKSKSGADISFSGIEFMSSAGPVGIFPERFCDDDRVYALNDNHIHIHHRPDFGWFDDDGTVFLRKSDSDAYEARYGGYLQVYINPAFQGVLTDLA
tara:strand:+ start:32 stop:1261 length:1230 start_codon:yes stop_codon:yes gene_type:complete